MRARNAAAFMVAVSAAGFIGACKSRATEFGRKSGS
jgi:hypothetical protein